MYTHTHTRTRADGWQHRVRVHNGCRQHNKMDIALVSGPYVKYIRVKAVHHSVSPIYFFFVKLLCAFMETSKCTNIICWVQERLIVLDGRTAAAAAVASTSVACIICSFLSISHIFARNSQQRGVRKIKHGERGRMDRKWGEKEEMQRKKLPPDKRTSCAKMCPEIWSSTIHKMHKKAPINKESE